MYGGKMNGYEEESLAILKEINSTLKNIFMCFEDQYKKIELHRSKMQTLIGILTAPRREIFKLLFEDPPLSQNELADRSNVSQQAVNKFINLLLDLKLIEKISENTGAVKYKDTYDLSRIIQEE
jgi:predicted transcriptional regulator